MQKQKATCDEILAAKVGSAPATQPSTAAAGWVFWHETLLLPIPVVCLLVVAGIWAGRVGKLLSGTTIFPIIVRTRGQPDWLQHTNYLLWGM